MKIAFVRDYNVENYQAPHWLYIQPVKQLIVRGIEPI
jgi:hypothetical protein